MSETQPDPRPFGTSEFNGFKGAPTTVVLKKDYRPWGSDEGTLVRAGTTIDLPAEEAARAIDLDIAHTPEEAAKSIPERDAVKLLTDLGYTVTAPKAVAPKTPFFAPKPDQPKPLNQPAMEPSNG